MYEQKLTLKCTFFFFFKLQTMITLHKVIAVAYQLVFES